MTDRAEQLAREIVEADFADNYFLANLLRPRLREANRDRRQAGMKPIRATQRWYFDEQYKRSLGTQAKPL